LSESDDDLAGADLFCDEILEVNRFKEEDLDDKEGVSYGARDNFRLVLLHCL
jgi:hypothetical protein